MEFDPKLVCQLKARLKEFEKNGEDLWSNIVKIAEEITLDTLTISDDGLTISHDFTIFKGSSVCRICRSEKLARENDDGYDYIIVRVDGKYVLQVRKIKKDKDLTRFHKDLFVRIKDQLYYVNSYIPGPWEKWLRFSNFQKQLENEKAEIKRSLDMNRKRIIEKSPQTDEEILASNFGFLTL